MPNLEDNSDAFSSDSIFNGAYDDENVGVVTDFNNTDDTINVSPIPTLRIHKNHLKDQILGDPKLAVQHNKHWIEAIRLFLAFASYMGFTVCQMDVKSAFLYGTIEEEVCVHQLPGFVDPAHPNKVYKVIKALYGLHQAPRAWYETLYSFMMEMGYRREFEDCMHKRFQMSSMGELTFFLGLQVKQQPDGKSLKVRISLWYLRDSPFELEAYSDSDYGGASLDRKSTTGRYVAAANDEGAVSERPSETQPTPFPPYPSADQHETQADPSPRPSPTIPIPDSILEGSGGNLGDLKSQIKQLKKKAKPVITHHKAWMKSVSMKQRLAEKKSLKKQWMQKESVSKQGRKPAKSKPTVHKDPAFDDLDDIMVDAMDYMETEDAQDEGRTSSMVVEEKESAEKGVSTKDPLSTAQPKVSTDKPKVSTAKPKEVKVSTDKLDKGTAEPKDGTSDESTAPITVFRDDETIAEFLVSMSQNKAKQKGVEIKDAEDSDRL
ncbi:putative ribonuclease H-like domain-containing protein [Tanacetum coccineum]